MFFLFDFANYPKMIAPAWREQTPAPGQWPSITAKKVRFDERRDHLHEATRSVGPEERWEQIRVRQPHVQQRFRVS